MKSLVIAATRVRSGPQMPVRNRKGSYMLLGHRPFAGPASHDIIFPSVRIGPDAFYLVLLSKILMRHTCGNHQYITLFHLYAVTIFSAQQ